MKKIVFLLSFLSLLGCSKKDEFRPSDPIPVLSFDLKVIFSEKVVFADNSTSFKDIDGIGYTIDSNGKVLRAVYCHFTDPKNNELWTYEYDEQGKLLNEKLNNKIFKTVKWDRDFAEVFNRNNTKISDFTFSNGRLIGYNSGFHNGNIENHTFDYDVNGNITAERVQNEIVAEYSDYDTSLSNPMNLLSSIGMLRIDSRPYFRNFFGTAKRYFPGNSCYDAFDETSEYRISVDSKNRIVSLTGDKTLIHKTRFEYK